MTLGKMIASAQRILRRYTICDWCLGRQFAMQGYGLTNKDRGVALKTLLLMIATEVYHQKPKRGTNLIRRLAENGQFEPARAFLEKEGVIDTPRSQDCEICQGVTNRFHKAARSVIKSLDQWEAHSILIGTKISPTIIEAEEQLRSEFQITTGEPIKAELNREIGKLVTTKLGLATNFENPDIVALIQIPDFHVELDVHSLFIYGRYKKLIRGIPQTRWPCRECGGRGCDRCKDTGKMYPESVEELIAPSIIGLTQGSDVKFHGAGREDIDALMLGNGRPFVIEVLRPRKRSVNLDDLIRQVNESTKGKIVVGNLRFANKQVVKRLKGSATSSKKIYKAIVQLETPIPQENLLALENLPLPLVIEQRTPQRVLHRRADRVRKKRVHTIGIVPLDAQSFELTISCQGGLYVKEFISGDEGRTIPSFAELLGTPAVCQQLDVIDVEIAEDKLPW